MKLEFLGSAIIIESISFNTCLHIHQVYLFGALVNICLLQSPQVCSEVLVGLRGFIQSPRPIQQGPALNVGFSVTAFHESISA